MAPSPQDALCRETLPVTFAQPLVVPSSVHMPRSHTLSRSNTLLTVEEAEERNTDS